LPRPTTRARLYSAQRIGEDASRGSVGTAYDTWHDEREAEDAQQVATAPWHLSTLRHLPDVRGLRVLEIGCGRGVFARELAERGADLDAADFSEAAVSHAARRLEGLHARVLVADIQSIPFEDETFDVVISQETLEHVDDPQLGLSELVRVTRHGGRLVVTGPNYLNMLGLYRIALRLVGRRFTEMGQPINQPLLLVEQARRLRRLGCQIESVEGVFLPLVIPGYRTFLLPARPRWLMRWFALETTIVATRF
jgi:2-polyprenyl-3-methyl-5-hydroxy-6-metoxy-1,4-benzoquinol methylase